MTAKSKAHTNNTLIASGLTALAAVAAAFFASPWIVEYLKKSPAATPTPATATVAPVSASAPTTAASVPAAPVPASASSTVDEQCLKKAWSAYNGAKYESAIKYAEQCIDSFGKAADRAQEKLDSEKEPLPPTGAVDDSEKNAIFKRGLLNDVATAYFIKGRSAEYLWQARGPRFEEYKDMAKEAYEATCRYKHARTWDPKGWFWSPCEAASDRLPLK